jgi:hypothetical protein
MRFTASRETRDKFRCLGNEDIADIVENGAKASFGRRRKYKPEDYEQLLRRMRRSCYLDEHDKLLNAKERLLEQYRRDGLVLFLGAGVSRGSEIPNWVRLSELMFENTDLPVNILDPNRRVEQLLYRFDQVYERLNGDQRQFLIKLYECLYRDFDSKLSECLRSIPLTRKEQLEWGRWHECREALAANKALAAVGELLVIGDGPQSRRNPQIHAVLTTNADNLLELYCEAQARGHRLVTQVDRASVGDHPNAIPVCHLHGTLDIRGENFLKPFARSWTKDLLPEVVFRREEYDKTIADHSSFVNHTPLSYLQRLNVLFIGTSLDDDNICRWLRESYEQRVKHRTKYLREYYRDQYQAAPSEAEWESVRHFWLCKKPENSREDERVRKLGVQIVWCEDYGAECLSWLKESGGCADFGRRSHQAPDCWCRD